MFSISVQKTLQEKERQISIYSNHQNVNSPCVQTLFPGSLFFPLGGRVRDPGNEFAWLHHQHSLDHPSSVHALRAYEWLSLDLAEHIWPIWHGRTSFPFDSGNEGWYLRGLILIKRAKDKLQVDRWLLRGKLVQQIFQTVSSSALAPDRTSNSSYTLHINIFIFNDFLAWLIFPCQAIF